MINEHIIKALLKSKIIYSFKLIYSHDLVFGITSLSMFLLMKAKNLLLAGLVKSLVLKKMHLFLSGNLVFTNGHINFRKM